MASLFQAFGQDMAYLGECSQGIGGGTGIPVFRATLQMATCAGDGKVRKLAEIMATVLPADEVGCTIPQCANEFIAAHEALGRNTRV